MVIVGLLDPLTSRPEARAEAAHSLYLPSKPKSLFAPGRLMDLMGDVPDSRLEPAPVPWVDDPAREQPGRRDAESGRPSLLRRITRRCPGVLRIVVSYRDHRP